jgi:hydrogenase nickel incorporation protein HypB
MQTGKSHAIDDEYAHGHGHDHDHSHEHGHEHSHDYEHDHEREHHHGHEHSHDHEHSAKVSTTVTLEANILEKNDRLAERNRGFFDALNILALNLVSAPGSGKTALLERTINDLKKELHISVVEGDQATLNDAERIKKTGAKVVQINTGAGCHLDAEMLATGIRQLDPPKDSVVMIENVGNLVCPALFDLGEKCKVAVLSITEGEDKPVKYPHMFRAAEVLLLNKIDLLPHLNFDIEACRKHALSVNPKIKIFEVSATRGEGLDHWYDWIKKHVREPQKH